MDVNVNGKRVLNAQNLVKVDPKQHLAAIDAAAHNKADDILFRAGGDLYVASGSDLSRKVKPGDPVEVAGIKGRVSAVDHEQAALVKEANAGLLGLSVAFAGVVGGAAALLSDATRGKAALGGIAGSLAGVAFHQVMATPQDGIQPDFSQLNALQATAPSPLGGGNGMSDELLSGALAGVTQLVLQKSQIKDLDRKLAADYQGTIKAHVPNPTAQKALLKLGETMGSQAASNLVSAGVGSLGGTVVELFKDDHFRALYATDPGAFAQELAKRGAKHFAIALGSAIVTGKVSQ